MKILLASLNANKLSEVRAIFADAATIVSPGEAGCVIDVVEDRSTFKGNAEKKALAFAGVSGMIALADDSGLEVDALGGAPGVYSARYAGPDCDYAKNNAKLLEELENVADDRRSARFRCVVACARDEVLFTTSGYVEGRITKAPDGENGFGYDPVFFYQPLGKTFARCTVDEKNAASHRGKAFRAACVELRKLFSEGILTTTEE